MYKLTSILIFPIFALSSLLCAMDAANQELNDKLIDAAMTEDFQMVQGLLKANASVDALSSDKKTALIWSAIKGNEKICLLLIERGAQIDIQDRQGNSALIWAAYGGHENICKLLIEHGTNMYLRNNTGASALAWSQNHVNIGKLIIDKTLQTIKERRSAAIALLSIKKYNRAPHVGMQDRWVIELIARHIYEPSKCKKREVILEIADGFVGNTRRTLLEYIQKPEKQTSSKCCIQ